MVAVEMLTRFQLIDGAAIGAFGAAAAAHIEIHLGVGVPGLHGGQGAGAKHTALVVQVVGLEFNGLLGHEYIS